MMRGVFTFRNSGNQMLSLMISIAVFFTCLGISAYAVEVVDWSQCPYCGSEADLFDDGTMRCPECLYACNCWDCASGSTIKSSTNSPYTYYEDYLAHQNEGPWIAISHEKEGHILNRHTISSIVSQLSYLTEDQVQGKLSKSFFNPDWSDSKVIDSVNYAYNEAIRNNHLNDTYTVTYLSETITIEMEHGQLKTGYGNYRYTLEEFLELYGGM